MPTIIIRDDGDHYTAHLKDNPQIFGTGKSITRAIGDMVVKNSLLLNFTLTSEDAALQACLDKGDFD